jgi:hypothetical protein
MFNLSAGVAFVLLLIAFIFLGLLGPRKLPAMAQILRGRMRRGMPQPVREAPQLSGLDWMLLLTGLALSFGGAALLARP